ncbi:hypothetical protein [Nonomuraea lactucae]|uniref:hypothetical protein n=1 Tax=Nonomuraea lactucae TaxID=2249762 RepID=UPI001966BC87|nr:hypothetical protein [Nonomuraea lactucae]
MLLGHGGGQHKKGPVGFWGVSLGSAIGVPLVAAEPRITAALFDAFASRGKTLHANRGRHMDVPAFELDSAAGSPTGLAARRAAVCRITLPPNVGIITA